MCDQQSLRSACAYEQSDQSLCLSLEYSMTVKLLTERHLEFLSFKGGYAGSSESTFAKMPYCWKSHVVAQFNLLSTCIYVLKINESQSTNYHNLALLIDELCIKKTKYDHNVYVKHHVTAIDWDN